VQSASEQTFYRWRTKYGALKEDEAQRLKALEQENARLMREAEKLQGQGVTIPGVCKKVGISEQAFYRWRANFGALKEDEAHRLKALEQENESADTTIEALHARGDQVVVMGEEVVVPQGAAANAGRTVRRRFTDVWREDSDGQWRLTIRQATITSVD
jgi:hypothetical protein